ncbi:hypothetical protein Clacol_010036 [Clathrus columnatus]|uniref:Uncharacterized protein n=1 Tax=Clathrus columnatus TaxID=1419009 RepID=A0AAV5ARX1_9AGAM|nr:hypothetical protein Clacol_010036 [Clathrus columnatus]
MSTCTDNPTTKPLTRPSRTNSTRSRKHSAPVQIHALLRTTSTDGTSRSIPKLGHSHRRGASLSASVTVSPTPVDRPTVANYNSTQVNNGADDGSTVISGLDPSNETSDPTHCTPSSSSSALQTRQCSHSYASAPLSTLITRIESPSLASFTLPDPHPCAAGSLRRCQWILEMNASGNWNEGQNGDDDESTNYIHVQPKNYSDNNKKTTLPTTSSPLTPKRKRMLALPLRLWKKKKITFANHKLDSESDTHGDVEDDTDSESESDGDDDDTPSLTPHSSRRSSRSRSSTDRSPASVFSSSPSVSRSNIPSISRKHPGIVHHSASPPVTGLAASGAMTAPSTVAVRCSGDAKVALSTSTGSSSVQKNVLKQDPETVPRQYKDTPTMSMSAKPSLSIEKHSMQKEPIPSSLSTPSRTLRSSKNRQITSRTSTPDVTRDMHIPFPTPPTPDVHHSQTKVANPALSPSSPCNATSPNSSPTVLLTLSDLERTSKLMRSTTTCAVCGRSGSDFPRCPRTGVAWCSRACRIAAKKGASS